MRAAIRNHSITIIVLASLLAGCGTLNVEVDFGNPTAAGSGIALTPSALPETDGTGTAPAPISTFAPSTAASATATTAPPVRAVDIALGKAHSCAVFDDGRVKCWGDNTHRQLGNGSVVGSNLPVQVEGLADVKALAAGWGHTCALTRAGGVKCWGYGKHGELGNGQAADGGTPMDVRGLSSGVIAIEAGDDHTCAVTDAGAVMCWGFNQYGQLGDGTTTSRGVPVPIQGPMGDGALGVAAGWGHTCILTAEKSVKCWGNNEYGQLGYGPIEDYRFSAMDVKGLELSAEWISADGGQSCALTVYGGIRCWGNNKYGQLGDGTSEVRSTPVAVTGLAQAMRDVTAGWNSTCGITVTGGLLCWGWNYLGQLGDGTKESRTTPTGVFGLADSVQAVGVGWGHTCAVTDAGGVLCWGANESGQLGDGTSLDSQAPQTVAGLAGGAAPARTETPGGT